MLYRRYRRPSVFGEMERLQREMNRLFDGYEPRRYRSAPAFPAINIWGSDQSLLVTSEVPGFSPKDINVSVVNDTLTINGERKPDEVKEDTIVHRRECGCGKFSRSVQLPYSVEANKVEASFKNGVLRIHLPRKEDDKPRKITVKTS